MKKISIKHPFAALCGAALLLCAGCVLEPPGPLLSRLAPEQSLQTPQLSAEERARYDEIDRQVIAEQNQAMAMQQWLNSYTPYYYRRSIYGGYYGGWGIGYGLGVGGW